VPPRHLKSIIFSVALPTYLLGHDPTKRIACVSYSSKLAIKHGGHATVAPTCEQEDRIVHHLRKRFGHVSAERVISGSSLENIYQAIAALERLEIPRRNATEITKNARRFSHASADFDPEKSALSLQVHPG
jgi:hypothetical protein